MAKHVWTVLCRSSVVDRETNILSLLDITEHMNMEGSADLFEEAKQKESPAVPVEFQLISFWIRSDLSVPETKLLRVYLVAPDAWQSPPVQASINLEGTYLRFRHRLNIGALPLRGPGLYTWCVQLNTHGDSWETVAEIPITVAIKVSEDGDGDVESGV